MFQPQLLPISSQALPWRQKLYYLVKFIKFHPNLTNMFDFIVCFYDCKCKIRISQNLLEPGILGGVRRDLGWHIVPMFYCCHSYSAEQQLGTLYSNHLWSLIIISRETPTTVHKTYLPREGQAYVFNASM